MPTSCGRRRKAVWRGRNSARYPRMRASCARFSRKITGPKWMMCSLSCSQSCSLFSTSFTGQCVSAQGIMFNEIKEPFSQKAKHLFNKLVHRVENKIYFYSRIFFLSDTRSRRWAWALTRCSMTSSQYRAHLNTKTLFTHLGGEGPYQILLSLILLWTFALTGAQELIISVYLFVRSVPSCLDRAFNLYLLSSA